MPGAVPSEQVLDILLRALGALCNPELKVQGSQNGKDGVELCRLVAVLDRGDRGLAQASALGEVRLCPVTLFASYARKLVMV